MKLTYFVIKGFVKNQVGYLGQITLDNTRSWVTRFLFPEKKLCMYCEMAFQEVSKISVIAVKNYLCKMSLESEYIS